MWGNLLDLSSFSANTFTLVYHLFQLISLLKLKLSGKRLMSNCPRFFAVVSSCSWVTSSRKILILLTTGCLFDRRKRSDKILISCKIPHIRSGWIEKLRSCRVTTLLCKSAFLNFITYILNIKQCLRIFPVWYMIWTASSWIQKAYTLKSLSKL